MCVTIECNRERHVMDRQCTQSHRHRCDGAQRSPRTSVQSNEIESGHVLHHPTSRSHDIAVPGDGVEPKHQIARRTERMSQWSGGRGRDRRADRSAAVTRRIQAEPLTVCRCGVRQFGHRGTGPRGDGQIARDVCDDPTQCGKRQRSRRVNRRTGVAPRSGAADAQRLPAFKGVVHRRAHIVHRLWSRDLCTRDRRHDARPAGD